jgi:Immunity protein 53
MKTGLALPEAWHASQSNGDWEHSWGVKIDNLDHPGWSISINLDKTRAETRNLRKAQDGPD